MRSNTHLTHTLSAAHSNPISCCRAINISNSSTSKQQGNSADCNEDIALGYAYFVSKLCLLAKTIA